MRFPRKTGVLLLSLSLATACGTAGQQDTTTSNALKLCTNAPFDPFEFEQDGTIVGFDIDLAGLVAKAAGRPLEVVNVDFDAISDGSALREGRCDLAAAGITITEERQRQVDFSKPYFEASQALLTRKKSKVKSLKDADQVGVQAGTTGLDYVRQEGLEPVEYDDSMEQLLALQTDEVDALVQDRPVVAVWLTKFKLSGELKLIGSLDTGEEYGMAVRKGDALLGTVDQALDAAKHDGTYERLYKQWFGGEPPEV
ncbi:transporter substrate-binding domain-containing protein [Nonomuraea sp. NPDC050663]|uniref:transporter substrate-binding domain-containing protein n=1 Tax=Nonomuraea sp. NPDC050663 TaxID=3364370 RepID=UPI00379DB212